MKKRITFCLLLFLITFKQYVFAESLDNQEIVLSFVGDCLLGSDLSYGSWNSFVETVEKQNNNYGYFFENVKSIFEADDLTIANLENPLTTATKKMDKEFVFKGDPSYVNILKEGFIDAVNFENNHSRDYFQQGYDDTIKALSQNNIGFFGADMYYIKEIKGIKIGFLGFKGYADTKELRNQIKKNIDILKQNEVKSIIVSFHFGKESVNYPIDTQKNLARFAIDNGATLIIGHHPHVIQGIEVYNNRPIVYSLGNFCFGGNRNPKDKDTFIFQYKLVFNDGDLKRTVSNIIPCSISSVSNRNDFRPTPLKDKEAQRVVGRLAEYSGKHAQFVKDAYYVGFNKK